MRFRLRDLDLEIRDGFGNLLDADYELDDQPGVYATALSAGSFNIFVDMIECSTGFCYYGLAVFTRSFGRPKNPSTVSVLVRDTIRTDWLGMDPERDVR